MHRMMMNGEAMEFDGLPSSSGYSLLQKEHNLHNNATAIDKILSQNFL